MNAWICDCGTHGIVSSQPSSARALVHHLASTGHIRGEYHYGGCGNQRTSIMVSLLGDGRYQHQLVR